MLPTLYYNDLILVNMQYVKNCKKCNNEYTYIGSAQNGYMWLCKKCNHIEWAPDKIN